MASQRPPGALLALNRERWLAWRSLKLKLCSQPSTHDLLISLDAIDHAKSEHFMEGLVKRDY
jgi:hypothetical protein